MAVNNKYIELYDLFVCLGVAFFPCKSRITLLVKALEKQNPRVSGGWDRWNYGFFQLR